jgi:hypothetical protein
MSMLATAIFVGSLACAPCHSVIANSYARTPMARSSGVAAALPPASFTASKQRYRIEGKTLQFDAGSASIDYFIGSNSEGRSFIHASDGYLFELPVTWYVRKNAWDASPGYEGLSAVKLNRAVEPVCLLCHSSQVRPVLGTQNRYGDPPFLEGGVSCERCHGPGSEHVRAPEDVRMVNPAKLDPARRDSVCSQCHLTGEARIDLPGRRFAEFQAGELLSDYASYFVWKLGRTDLKVTSHVEKLAASRCKQSAGDALWCGSCHDVHSNRDKSQQACVSCHAAAHRQDENCASCHMPKTRAVDANHGVMTDHSIPRVPHASAPPKKSGLVAFLGKADDRSLGLAYAELGDSRAREYLLRAKPADWRVRLRLAVFEQDPARAAALYESVLRDNPGEPAALVNLGGLYAAAGRTKEAAALWTRALQANPAIEEAVLNLSQVLPAPQSKDLLKRYLTLNPSSAAARARLFGR